MKAYGMQWQPGSRGLPMTLGFDFDGGFGDAFGGLVQAGTGLASQYMQGQVAKKEIKAGQNVALAQQATATTVGVAENERWSRVAEAAAQAAPWIAAAIAAAIVARSMLKR